MLKSTLQYLFIILTILSSHTDWQPQIYHSHIFTSRCLTPASQTKPVGECYDIPVSGPANRIITIQHQTGSTVHRVVTFSDQGQTQFRFTPDKMGVWHFDNKQQIDINQPRPDYAKGFVVANGNKWARSANMTPFSPQYIMADLEQLSETELGAKINELIINQGFTGFHITNLREFLARPAFFEALIIKTYRAGGATHFWIWGDAERHQTPNSYGVDVNALYQSITARLAPLPGWSVGFGFDLHEWVTQADIELWQHHLTRSSYRHLLGARGNKNSYINKIKGTDYCSYEWHKPQLSNYLAHLQHCPNQPVFSEDRFRIRQHSRYPDKDYNEKEIISGLWDALIAGGVANIWGKQDHWHHYSAPFQYQNAIKTYQQVTENHFQTDMEYSANIISNGECLAGQNRIICYLPNSQKVKFTKPEYQQWRWIKIAAFQPYQEQQLMSDDLQQASDWILVGINPLFNH